MSRRTTYKLFSIAGIVFAAIAVAGANGAVSTEASAKQDRGPALQHELDQLTAAGAPGAVLLVRDRDRALRLASGLADVAHKRAMRPGDRFRTASLTKSYVATVVLQLVGEGRLSLEDSIDDHLPGLVPGGDRITIRQLLNHTSGVFDLENDTRVLKPYLRSNLGYHWPPRRLVQIAVSHKPLFKPGARYSYSNTNYLVAGLIVQAVTKHSLGEELRRRIFRPLGLRATTFPTTPRMPNPHAHGYYVPGKPPALDVTGLSPFPWAAGAIVSTAGDVATFYRALFSGRLLKPELLRAMETTVAEGRKVDIPGQRAGLGLERFPTRCGHAWGHNGVFPGYFVYAFSSRDGRRQAVLMVNEDAGSLPKPARTMFFRTIMSGYCG
jgi:D-alanyl-D-alanine carboxypeptidase